MTSQRCIPSLRLICDDPMHGHWSPLPCHCGQPWVPSPSILPRLWLALGLIYSKVKPRSLSLVSYSDP